MSRNCLDIDSRCDCGAVEIILPPCEDYVKRELSLCVAKPFEEDCKKCVEDCFTVRDLKHIRYCYIYHRGTYYCENGTVACGYGISLKYIDCCGNKRAACHEGTVIFSCLPCCFNPKCFNVVFSGLQFCADSCGCVKVSFTARLCADTREKRT